MQLDGATPRGTRRGALSNPPSRFAAVWRESSGPSAAAATRTLCERSRSIVTCNDSPDVPFDATINPYRGCEHGCAYCYARIYHELLELSAGLDFEARIVVKENAAERLERELASPSWRPRPVALSGATDPYQPVEGRLGITRSCLEALAAVLNPVAVITKSALVARDAELLLELARHRAAAVAFSITTLDERLARRLEPRAAPPQSRLRALSKLATAGVPCGVLVAPVIPGLTDHEIPAIVGEAAAAGARFAGWSPVRLPGSVAELFDEWLGHVVPERRHRVLARTRDLRGGELDDRSFRSRMRGTGPLAETLDALFTVACRRHGVTIGRPELATDAFRPRTGRQLTLPL